MKTHRILSLVLLSCFTAAGASLAGLVKDPQGRPVPGVALKMYSRTGGASAGATSDSTGAYRFEGLPQGDYLLRAEAAGFATFFAEDIHLETDSPRQMEVALQIAGVHEQVVVTASSTPQAPEEVSKAITTIDRSDAEARDSLALSDVVALAPSVRVQQLGGPGAFTSIQIRGLRDQDTAVLVDGLRLRDPSGTQADATGLIEDLLFTDSSRVEVMRGSGSSLYGTNAIGGVINVITDEGGGRTRGSLLMEGGSLGTGRGRGQVAGSLDNGRVDYSAGVAQTYVARGVDGDDPFRDTNSQGRVTFHLSPTVQLIARLYAGNSFLKTNGEPSPTSNIPASGIVNAIALTPSNASVATFIPAPDDPDSTRAARFLTGALILNGQSSPRLDYSIGFQTLETSRRYGDGPAGSGPFQPSSSTRSLYDGRIQTMNAHASYRLGSFNILSGGYEFENENYANDNSQAGMPLASSVVQVTQLSHSFFVQDQARLFGDRLQLSGAFRAQYFTLDRPVFGPADSAPYQGIAFPSPSAAYTGDASAAYFFRKSGTKIRAHAGRGYRAPSLFERFGAGFDPTFGYTVYGDPLLKPEHSVAIDVGLEQTFWKGRVKTSATYFYTWLQQVIAFDSTGLLNPATDPFDRFIGYLNTRGGISRGVELTAVVAPTRSLNITTAYTFVNAAERAPIVGDILRTFVIPRNQFSIVATEQAGSRTFFTFDTLASSNYLEPIFGDVTRVYRFNGPHKVNAGVSYRIPLAEYKAIRFFVRGENIFNQNYYEAGFATPERTGIGGMQFEF